MTNVQQNGAGGAESHSIARRRFLVGLGAGSALLVLDAGHNRAAAAAPAAGGPTAYVALTPPTKSGDTFAVINQGSQDGVSAPFFSTGPATPGGEAGKVGILKSKAFAAPASLSFWLAGQDGLGQPLHKNFVQLVDATSGQVLQKAEVPHSDAAEKVSWDLSNIAGLQVYLEIVDGNDGDGWAWLSFGRLEPGVVAMPTASGQPIPGDWTAGPLPPGSQSVDGVPFLTGTFWPANAAEGSTFSLPAYGVQASYLYLLGGANTVDQAQPGWGTGDSHQGFFVGDEIGTLMLRYGDGGRDALPLVYGYNVWWRQPFQGYPAPFNSDPKAQQLLADALDVAHGAQGYQGSAPPYYIRLALRGVPLTKVEVLDSKAKNGHFAINAVTFGDVQKLPSDSGAYQTPDGELMPSDVAQWLASHTIDATRPYPQTERDAVSALGRFLYTYPSDISYPTLDAAPPAVTAKNFRGPTVQFSGSPVAEIMTRIYYENSNELISGRIDPQTGMAHESHEKSPNFSGCGGYIPNLGPFYDDSYTRIRAIQLVSNMGFAELADKAIGFFDDWAMYFPRNYPELQLGGKPVPAHATVIANHPLIYFDQLRQAGWPTRYTTHDFGNGENDGNGMLMLARWRRWCKAGRPASWVQGRWEPIEAIGEYIPWCLDNPDLSFSEHGLLYSESEGGMQIESMFCDLPNYYGLLAYAQMAEAVGQPSYASRWRNYAAGLLSAMNAYYPYDDPRWGTVWDINKSAGWNNRHATLAPLLYGMDYFGYDVVPNLPAGWLEITKNTYRRQLTHNQPDFCAPMGMGYGQGFITESALLLDEIADATRMVEWMARLNFAPRRQDSYRVSEGATVASDGSVWQRWGDLGNLFQLGEVVYTCQLLLGIDDMSQDHLRLMPRLPNDWSGITVTDWPVRVLSAGTSVQTNLSMTVKRAGDRIAVDISSDRPVDKIRLRVGPFPQHAKTATAVIRPNPPGGGDPVVRNLTLKRIGDSTWAWTELTSDTTSYQINTTITS